MRTATFLVLFLMPLSVAHGETVFFGSVVEAGPKTDTVRMEHSDIRKELYTSPESGVLEGLVQDMLLSEECAVGRISDSFDSRQIETSI